MSYINRSDVEFKFPFRMSILGPMNSGKSHFLIELLKQVEHYTNIKALSQKIILVFCYNNESSYNGTSTLSIIDKICNENSHFLECKIIYKLPSFKQI